jgi:hypothetical protein
MGGEQFEAFVRTAPVLDDDLEHTADEHDAHPLDREAERPEPIGASGVARSPAKEHAHRRSPGPLVRARNPAAARVRIGVRKRDRKDQTAHP